MSPGTPARPRKMTRARATALVTVLVLLALAAIGGTLASLTDADETQQKVLRAGTVDIEVLDDDLNPSFDQPIDPMAPGDTWSRYLNVKNQGTLPIRPLSLSQTNGGGHLIDGDLGVDVAVSACSQAWKDGACGGTEYSPALPAVQLRSWAGAAVLDVPGMKPGETMYFKFVTHLSADADNSYQAESSWAQYTFNAIQRGAERTGDDTDSHNDPDDPDNSGGTPIDPSTPPNMDASKLTAVPQNSNRIALTWTSVPSATTYRLERLPYKNGTTVTNPTTAPANAWTVLSIGPDLEVTDRFAQPATRYYYRVVALDVFGHKSYSNIVNETTWMLNADVKLRAQAATASTIQLAWAEIAGAESYTLEAASDDSFADATTVYSGTSGKTTFIDTGLTQQTTRHYRLTVVGPGRTLTATTVATTTIPVPVIRIDAATSQKVVLSWTPISGATYTLTRRITGVGRTTVYTGPGTAYTDTAVTPGSSVDYELTATVAADTTSALVSIQIPEIDRTQVPALTFTRITDTSATVAWTESSAATGYRLETAPTAAFDTEDIQVLYSGTARSFDLTGLDPHSQTFYRVVAVDATTEDNWSSPVRTLTTLLSAVVLDVAPSDEPDQVDQAVLSWTGPTEDGLTYTVQMRRVGDGSYATVTTTTDFAWVIDDLTPGSYEFRVFASAADGMRVDSETKQLTLTGLGTPALDSVATNAGAAVAFAWRQVPGATSYRLEHRNAGAAPTDPWTSVASVAAAGAIDGAFAREYVLPGSSELDVRVVADNGTERAASAPVRVLTTPLFATVDENLRYSNATEQYTWTWTSADRASTTATSYTVTFTPSSDPQAVSTLFTGPADARSATFAPATRTEAGTLRLNAVDQHGQAAAVRTMPLAPAPLPPTNVSVIPVSETVHTVSWDASASAGSYVLGTGSYDTANGSLTSFAKLCDTTGTSCTVNLDPGKRYPNVILLSRALVGNRYSTPVPVVLAAPVGASALSYSATASAVSLSWTSVVNGVSYQVEKSATAGFENPTVLYTGTQLSYSDAGLAPGSTAFYRVVTRGENDTVKASNVVNAGPVAQVIDASVSSVTVDQASLSWTPVSGADRYTVSRGTSADMTPAATRYDGTATSFTDTGLASDVRYFYTVAAYSGATLLRSTAAPLTVITRTQTPTMALEASDWGTSAVTVRVNTNAAPAGLLEFSADGGSTWAALKTTAAFGNVTATFPDRTRRYALRLSGVSQYGGRSSDYVTLTSVAVAPSAPSSTVAELDHAHVKVAWTEVPGTTYRVERSVGSGATTEVYAGTALSFTDTAVVAETRYSYYVTAVAPTGAVSNESISRADVPVKAATLNAPVLIDSNTATLTWEPGGRNDYVVYVSSSPGTLGTAATSTTGTSATVSSLVAGTTTYFTVRTKGSVTASTVYDSYSNQQSLVLPAAGATLTATALNTTTVDLTWPKITATSHLVQYSMSPNFTSPVTVAANLAGAASTYRVGGLTASTRYWFRLTSSDGPSTYYSNIVSVGTKLPTNPTVTVSSVTPSSNVSTMSAAWTPVAGATTYRADLQLGSGTTSVVETQTVTGTSVTFATTQGGNAQFKVTVTAMNDADSSSSSSVLDYTVPSDRQITDAKFSVPQTAAVSIAGGGSTGLTQVSAYSDAQLTQRVSSAAENTTTNAATVGSLVNGRTYWFVTERKINGGSTWLKASTPVQVTSPKVVTTVRAAREGTSTAFSWDPVPGATGYRLLKAVTNATTVGTGSTIYSGPATSFTDLSTPSVTGTVRYVVVPEGVPNSFPSLIALNRTTTAPAGPLTATQISPTQVRLSWPAVPGATRYRVKCATGLDDVPSDLWTAGVDNGVNTETVVTSIDGFCALSASTPTALMSSPTVMLTQP